MNSRIWAKSGNSRCQSDWLPSPELNSRPLPIGDCASRCRLTCALNLSSIHLCVCRTNGPCPFPGSRSQRLSCRRKSPTSSPADCTWTTATRRWRCRRIGKSRISREEGVLLSASSRHQRPPRLHVTRVLFILPMRLSSDTTRPQTTVESNSAAV